MRSLLLCVLITTIAVQVFCVDENVNKLACINDLRVNPSLVEKAYNGQISDARELKCYFKCYYENAGYLNKDGKIDANKMKEHAPTGTTKTKAATAVDLCAAHKGGDACETAYLVQKCLLNNNVKY